MLQAKLVHLFPKKCMAWNIQNIHFLSNSSTTNCVCCGPKGYLLALRNFCSFKILLKRSLFLTLPMYFHRHSYSYAMEDICFLILSITSISMIVSCQLKNGLGHNYIFFIYNLLGLFLIHFTALPSAFIHYRKFKYPIQSKYNVHFLCICKSSHLKKVIRFNINL